MTGRGKIREWTLVAAVFFLMVLVRILVGSYSEYGKGERFFNEKKYDFAAVHYERAVQWYFPFNPFTSRSVDRLKGIGALFEGRGDLEKALEAYEILRSSIYGTRSFYTPFKSAIDFTDEKIASIRSELIANDPEWEIQRSKPTRDEILKELKKDNAPSVFFSILASLGLIGWIACVIFFILRVLNREVFPKKTAVITGVLFFAFYLIWMIGLARA